MYANGETTSQSSSSIYIGIIILLVIIAGALFIYARKQKDSPGTSPETNELREKAEQLEKERELLLKEKEELAQKNSEQEVEISTLNGNKRELEQILVAKIKENDSILREATEKEETAKIQVQQAETIQDSFFVETIHEMRTPLSLVLGSLSLVVQNKGTKEELSTQLLSAYRNTLAMQDLADQLIGTRHSNDVANYLRIARYDLIEITKQICDLFVDWIAMNNVDFRVTTQTDVLWLWIDRRKTEYALRTLLTNALKNTFMFGKVLLDIAVEDHNGTSYCSLSVQDEGLDENEGARRGLKQIEDMIDDLGGMFRKDTTPNGSTFTLYIPVGKKHLMEKRVEFVEPEGDLVKLNDKQKEEIAELIQIVPQKKATGKKLLMIDDSDQIRWFLRHVFSKEYQVLEANNGAEGVKLAKSEMPDLILCDVMMPVMDGYEACREIKSDPKTTQIPVVMLTAKVESEDVIKGIEAGADDYITKPFDVEILRSKVSSMLRRRDQLKHFYTRSLIMTENGQTIDGQEGGTAAPSNPFMDAVIRNIEKHLDDSTFEAKVLADSLNMSLPTLYRKIKQYSDCSILELTRTIRLKKAAELILTQQHSIQEVSEMVGFNDTATFRKRFTEQFGVTPSQYGQPVH
ncbi:response regulator [Parabacteroides sp. OttesenSCG-928-G07]|nr:response regulator [Parabacteroides sp. OttesenSCG-928-G07]